MDNRHPLNAKLDFATVDWKKQIQIMQSTNNIAFLLLLLILDCLYFFTNQFTSCQAFYRFIFFSWMNVFLYKYYICFTPHRIRWVFLNFAYVSTTQTIVSSLNTFHVRTYDSMIWIIQSHWQQTIKLIKATLNFHLIVQLFDESIKIKWTNHW